MKVLFLVRNLGLGGVERCVALVSERLVQAGYEVTIALLGGQDNLWAEHTRNVQVVDLSHVWHGKKPWTWFAGCRAARRLARQADVVVASTFLMPLYMGWAATRGLHKRLLAWVHGPYTELDAFTPMNPIHRFACRWLYRRQTELVCVSEHARDSLCRWLHCQRQAGWQVIANFAEPPTTQPVLPVARTQATAPIRILFVGRIAEEKQPQLWLDTLSALNSQKVPAQLTIVGDGPLKGWLQEQMAQQGLATQITLAGQQNEVGPYLASHDVLLLTSRFEGCPLVVLEAMQYHLPAIATNAGGVYELFGERQNDFVVAEASGQALATALLRQREQWPELHAWLQQRALLYTPDSIMHHWFQLLGKAHIRHE